MTCLEHAARTADTGAPVRLDGFTPTTYDFLATIIETCWGHPTGSFQRPTTIPFESAAGLFFILRGTDDAAFPGGKWATIQHLEEVIDDREQAHHTA